MPALKQRLNSVYTKHNKVKLVRGGRQYFTTLLHMIARATESIHLQTYIYEADETGKKLADALIAAAGRKVQVYLITDGYASQDLPQDFIDRLKKAGIHFRFFEPLFKSRYYYFGRRLHHKMVVVDVQYAMVGGINISDRYNDMPGKPAWLDFALHVEGEIVKQLCILCWKTWKGFQPVKNFTGCKERDFDNGFTGTCLVRMRRNDWVWRKDEVSKTYREMFRSSTSHITILCSYFLPGNMIRKSIARAVKRGVKIKVILTGVSDVPVAKNAERFMYDWLLRNKVEIYEYQKNVLHGKVAVCDLEWVTMGSYNMNDISAYASIELNLDVKNPSFAKHVEQTMEEIIAHDCILVSKEQHLHSKNVFRRFIRWFSYQFFRAAFNLFTFYFRQRGRN